jgi:hypothetical protein
MAGGRSWIDRAVLGGHLRGHRWALGGHLHVHVQAPISPSDCSSRALGHHLERVTIGPCDDITTTVSSTVVFCREGGSSCLRTFAHVGSG